MQPGSVPPDARVREGYIDETGKQYGNLHVIAYHKSAGEGRRRAALFECVCVCGEIILVRGQKLRNGGVTMCQACYAKSKGA
jgi:hypothetical protein